MINMICDNCGAKIDENEEYCPNCGMQLLDLPPKHAKKKKNYKNSGSFSRGDSRSVEKPIKQRYIGNSTPESPEYSQYLDEDEYGYEEGELPEEIYYEEDYKEKSGSGIGNIILLLFIALILGFIVGIMLFSSQSIPSIPGFNN